MPFFDPFKFFFGYEVPVIKTDISLYIKIICKLQRRVMIKFFVFVPVLVPQGRQITENCRCGRKTAGTFSIKKLFVSKSTFNDHAIVLILYKTQMIILFHKLRKYKSGHF